MEDNKFNRTYSKKPVVELINQLRTYMITGYGLSNEGYKALVAHLAERELSGEERKQVDDILSSKPETRKAENVTGDQQTTNESEKYPALRTIAGIFFVFAVIIGLATIAGAFYFFAKGEESRIIAISIIIVGSITTLMQAAASELIGLFIDIEKNTRQSAKKD